jgi:hypothetical protein
VNSHDNRSKHSARRACAVVTAAAIAAAVLAASLAPADAASGTQRQIAFLAKSVSQSVVDPSFPQAGDTAVAVLNNIRHGRMIGNDRTACVVVDASSDMQCTSTVGLQTGTLEAEFTQNVNSRVIVGAITGDTGRCAGARGSFTLRRIGVTSNFNASIKLL